jgi:uncharacterized protein (TIGR04255 family)
MSDSPRRPHFAKPPVVEVACGVQFEGLEQWRTPHYGKFWTTIQQDYSNTEDHPPLPRVRLDPAPVVFEPQWSPMPPLRRVFFIKPPGNFLMQLQQNRLLHNWRKVADVDEYPRFDAAFERFTWAWQQFNEFLPSVDLPGVRPEIWELTYINHIVEKDACFPRDVWEYLGFYETSPIATTAMAASAMAIQFVWPLPDQMGTPSLDVKHGNRVNDRKEVLVVELTVRGPAKEDSSAMKSWFGVAHDAIVNNFERLTTKRAHNTWEKL